jgi:hypothetical protein
MPKDIFTKAATEPQAFSYVLTTRADACRERLIAAVNDNLPDPGPAPDSPPERAVRGMRYVVFDAIKHDTFNQADDVSLLKRAAMIEGLAPDAVVNNDFVRAGLMSVRETERQLKEQALVPSVALIEHTGSDPSPNLEQVLDLEHRQLKVKLTPPGKIRRELQHLKSALTKIHTEYGGTLRYALERQMTKPSGSKLTNLDRKRRQYAKRGLAHMNPLSGSANDNLPETFNACLAWLIARHPTHNRRSLAAALGMPENTFNGWAWVCRKGRGRKPPSVGREPQIRALEQLLDAEPNTLISRLSRTCRGVRHGQKGRSDLIGDPDLRVIACKRSLRGERVAVSRKAAVFLHPSAEFGTIAERKASLLEAERNAEKLSTKAGRRARPTATYPALPSPSAPLFVQDLAVHADLCRAGFIRPEEVAYVHRRGLQKGTIELYHGRFESMLKFLVVSEHGPKLPTDRITLGDCLLWTSISAFLEWSRTSIAEKHQENLNEDVEPGYSSLDVNFLIHIKHLIEPGGIFRSNCNRWNDPAMCGSKERQAEVKQLRLNREQTLDDTINVLDKLISRVKSDARTMIDSNEAILPILNAEDPSFVFSVMLQSLLAEVQTLVPGSKAYAHAVRDVVLVAIQSQAAFRPGTLSRMSVDNLQRDTDGHFRLRVERSKFKNSEGPYFQCGGGQYRDFERRLALDPAIERLLKEYVRICRHMLLDDGTNPSLAFFPGPDGSALNPKTFSPVMRQITARHAVLPLQGTPFSSIKPFSAHACRKILCTSVVNAALRYGRSLAEAIALGADSIADSVATADEIYAIKQTTQKREDYDKFSLRRGFGRKLAA